MSPEHGVTPQNLAREAFIRNGGVVLGGAESNLLLTAALLKKEGGFFHFLTTTSEENPTLAFRGIASTVIELKESLATLPERLEDILQMDEREQSQALVKLGEEFEPLLRDRERVLCPYGFMDSEVRQSLIEAIDDFYAVAASWVKLAQRTEA